MKKLVFISILLSNVFCCFAQQGVQFEHKLNWKEILQKAKEENKYVFVDCFATWCRPCKYMEDSVFQKKEAGDFFNVHFINVKVQMDQTVKDDERVKNWYVQAKMIDEQYNVDAYPSFLFINPNGELVYKAAGAFEAGEFIRKASKALDKDEQYFFLLEEYNTGKRDPVFIKQLLTAAEKQEDKEMIIKLEALKRPGS